MFTADQYVKIFPEVVAVSVISLISQSNARKCVKKSPLFGMRMVSQQKMMTQVYDLISVPLS